MTDVQKEVKHVEKELVSLIVRRLKENTLSVEQVQRMAAAFIEILPVRDQADLLAKMRELSNNYREVRDIYLKEITQINKLQREQALTQMRNAIAQGKIEHAITIAKAMQTQANKK